MGQWLEKFFSIFAPILMILFFILIGEVFWIGIDWAIKYV